MDCHWYLLIHISNTCSLWLCHVVCWVLIFGVDNDGAEDVPAPCPAGPDALLMDGVASLPPHCLSLAAFSRNLNVSFEGRLRARSRRVALLARLHTRRRRPSGSSEPLPRYARGEGDAFGDAVRDEVTELTDLMERGRTGVRCLLTKPTMEPRGTGVALGPGGGRSRRGGRFGIRVGHATCLWVSSAGGGEEGLSLARVT